MITKEEAIKKLEARIAALQAKIDEINKPVTMDADPTCDKNNPNDPHYGDLGDYTQGCVWVPDNG